MTTEEAIILKLSLDNNVMPRRELLRSLRGRRNLIQVYNEMATCCQIEETGTGKSGDPVMTRLLSPKTQRQTKEEQHHRLIDLVGRATIVEFIGKLDCSAPEDIAHHIRRAMLEYTPKPTEPNTPDGTAGVLSKKAEKQY